HALNSVIRVPFFCHHLAASDNVPPLAKPGVHPWAAARRIAYTLLCPPMFLTSLAVRTCSLFDKRAGTESDVDVPGPLTRPPVANPFGSFTRSEERRVGKECRSWRSWRQ